MPLATPLQLIDSAILADTKDALAAAHLAVSKVNNQTRALLRADNALLTSWLQGKAQELDKLLTRHAEVGIGLNAVVTAMAATLTEAGIPTTPQLVDTSPLPAKLAAKKRAIDLATLTVTDMP